MNTKTMYPVLRYLVLVSLLTFVTISSHAANEIAMPALIAAASGDTQPEGRKLLTPLSGKLVTLKGSALVVYPSDQLKAVRYVAVYYSAHWCPPCRAFTPKLVAAYKELKAAHPEFEVIFVSSDEDADAMKNYMKETGMQWPALKFEQKDNMPSFQRPAYENGIPNLVFMTADGKELATSYNPNGDYNGPYKVLEAIQQHFKK